MKNDQFIEETDAKNKELKGSIDYFRTLYTENVEPYLELINYWKFTEKMNMGEIRRVLKLTKSEWALFAHMPTVKEYTSTAGGYMQAKTQKEFLEAKKDNMHNAKFHEMSFKRFDKGYGESGEINVNIPPKIEFNVKNSGLSQDEIIQKANGQIDGSDE
jgi:hypothetical protein